MIKANWKEAPHDAETWEKIDGECRFCKPGHYYGNSGRWFTKSSTKWTILEHRPRIIAWEDMKEGMVVRCVDTNEDGNWYRIGELCDVSTDEAGDFGPLNTCGDVTPCPECYTFELVSKPKVPPNISAFNKTVQDAVKENPEWKAGIVQGNVYHAYLPFSKWMITNSEDVNTSVWTLVCTREEFEAEVKRLDPNNWEVLIDSPESEQEWTHTWKGNRCRIVSTEDYRSWIKGPALDTLVQTDELKPIKPTITKAQAWEEFLDIYYETDDAEHAVKTILDNKLVK